MNWDSIEGNWREYKGKVKERWGKLTDGDLTAIAGKRDQLVGKLQQAYALAKEEAEQQVREFQQELSKDTDSEGENDDPDWSGHAAGTH